MRTVVAAALAALLLGACGGAPAETPTPPPSPSRPSPTPPPTATAIVTPTAEPVTPEEAPGLPLPVMQTDLFSTSGACGPCHTGMRDDRQVDVSLDSAWRATMMANAARDPYWQAALRAEVLRRPERRAEIEDLCATCHMPMARFELAAGGQQAAVLDDGMTDPDHPLHRLAMDGVSCALCHQIRETNLGPASYSGRFQIDTGLPVGERLIFGPYSVEPDQAAIMRSASGFVPVQAVPWGTGLHISQSELCATCHTVYTPVYDAAGQPAGEFPEQVTYLEWYYSDYRRTRTCQDCHMPPAEGGVRIATTSTSPRSPFAQHLFVGGNVTMLEILRAFGEELGVTASGPQLGATIDYTLDQLQNRTARITLEEASLGTARLLATVAVENLAGHKFPTGFPSRRAWIRFTVRDGDGQIVFQSGGVNPDGSIIGNDNDADPGRFEPHYQNIGSQEQVQIYEAVLRDSGGLVTTSLLSAAGYLKDNRLPPAGYQKGAPYADIAVRGEALEDVDFDGGRDRVEYVVPLGEARGPFTVTAELLYQSVGFRWARNLEGLDGPEIGRFLGYLEALPPLPVVVAEASQTLER